MLCCDLNKSRFKLLIGSWCVFPGCFPRVQRNVKKQFPFYTLQQNTHRGIHWSLKLMKSGFAKALKTVTICQQGLTLKRTLVRL